MIENKIRVLPEFIANQIAAGEVVQRPESVVKELVENSIDAGADSIVVIVKQSGKKLIHIVDNGQGMNKEDLKLSIRRHATSKVFTSEDLEQIKTFGFRGEALASVCSVANVEIRTKQSGSEFGWQLISEPLKDELINPFNADKGTQIFIRNLFYNVPARRKFLKSDMTEFKYISDTMIKFALSYPEIRFTFYDDNVLIFDVKATDLFNRINEILGSQISNKLIPISYKDERLEINGYIGGPELAKQNRSGQYFFLNRRAIFSPTLAHSINSVYEKILDRNQKPFFIINLTVDYKKIDINIHPQKNEVKFEEERFIYNTLKDVVSSALFNKHFIPDLNEINITSPFINIQLDNEFIEVNKVTGEILDTTPNRAYDNLKKNYNSTSYQKIDNYQEDEKSRLLYQNNQLNSAFDLIFSNKQEVIIDNPIGKVYQLLNRYIINEFNNELEIYEQNSTHKRIIYDSLKSNSIKFETNKLLFPINIDISIEDKPFFKENLELLNKAGFYFKIDSKLCFYEIPSLISEGKESEVLNDLVIQLIQLPNIINLDIVDNIYKEISNTLAIKVGQVLSIEEMKALIINLKKCEHKLIAPNGARIYTKLNSEQFYQKFLRI
ncbi:MAG TPA: DNA mismatch repair endonuclease MutL [Candidatus Kapabacteria bacterium]|nr:DNA mismatch repair endonuclease MutL [Candidatus Kapabacteria bacterium]